MADTPTPNYGFLLQQPGTNANTWGGKLNGNWSSIDGLLHTATTNAATALSASTNALQTTGGTMVGDLVLSSIAPSSPLSVGYRGLPARTITGNDTLVATDAGCEVFFEGTATATITVPPVGTVGFQGRPVITIRNFSAFPVTLAQGASVALRLPLAGTFANRTIPAWGQAVLKMEKPNEWLVMGAAIS